MGNHIWITTTSISNVKITLTKSELQSQIIPCLLYLLFVELSVNNKASINEVIKAKVMNLSRGLTSRSFEGKISRNLSHLSKASELNLEGTLSTKKDNT